MLLAFDQKLHVATKFDPELVLLADRHYSRQKIGSYQFLPPGRTLVIRDNAGLVVFGWLHQQYRDDNEEGYNCAIFRNESARRSSDVILECEALVVSRWGKGRAFTYINPAKIRSTNPGYCFKQAGWRFVRQNPDGKHILEKQLAGDLINNPPFACDPED